MARWYIEMPSVSGMTGPDARKRKALRIAEALLIQYTRNDIAGIDRVIGDLAVEDDPKLTMQVLDAALQVSVGLVVLLAARVGVNPRRAIEDAFQPGQ
jgi:hypothetical protein